MGEKSKKPRSKAKRSSIGLDIDEKSIKFVTIEERDAKKFITKFSIKDIPPSDDKVAATIGIIKQIISEEKIEPGSKVYTCVYGVGPTIRRVSIPIMPDSEIPEAVKWEVRNLIPFPIEGAAVDDYKIGKVSEKGVEKYDVLAAVVQNEILDKLLNICSQAGLQVEGIGAIPFALWNIVKEGADFKEEEVVAVIDIGAEAAGINLFKNNILQFTRDITVAGDSITKAMTGMLVADEWQLNLSYEQAEEIKVKYGIPSEGTAEKTKDGIPLIHILEMISPTLRRLQNEILRSFDYYKDQFREEKIDRIFLTGGSSSLKNLDTYLSEALGIKVQILDALRNINIDEVLMPREALLRDNLQRLSLAIGLAIGQTQLINFLKVKRGGRGGQKLVSVEFLKNVKLPPTALIATGVIVIAVILGLNFYLTTKRNMYREELRSKQNILSDIRALNQRKQILSDIARQETNIRAILVKLTEAFPKGILLTNLIYDNSRRQMWLSGTAPYTGTVGQLIKNLEDSAYFKDVSLIEIKRQALQSGGTEILFRTTFSLE